MDWKGIVIREIFSARDQSSLTIGIRTFPAPDPGAALIGSQLNRKV